MYFRLLSICYYYYFYNFTVLNQNKGYQENFSLTFTVFLYFKIQFRHLDTLWPEHELGSSPVVDTESSCVFDITLITCVCLWEGHSNGLLILVITHIGTLWDMRKRAVKHWAEFEGLSVVCAVHVFYPKAKYSLLYWQLFAEVKLVQCTGGNSVMLQPLVCVVSRTISKQNYSSIWC